MVTIFGLGFLSKFWVENMDLQPGVVAAMGVNPTFDTFQGSILQEQAFQNPKILPLYGSSEMSMIYDYQPAKVFTPETGFTPFLVGKGGSQTLIHVLNIAALQEKIKGRKLAIFLTPQWYVPGGISQSTFEGNFSALHVYEMLKNPTLSSKLKREMAKRLLEFPKAYKDFPYLEKLLTLQAQPSGDSLVKRILYTVPSQMEYDALVFQDAAKTDWHIKKLPKKTISYYAGSSIALSKKEANLQKANLQKAGVVQLPWDKLRVEAIEEGKKATGHNPFGMDDGFYREHIEPKLQERKDSDQNAKLYPSQEYEDLKLLMSVLKEKGATPLFVIIPMNGRWSDYTGFSQTERQACYQRLAQMIRAQGLALADFSAHEKDDYYLRDPWHLAWKGWVDVDEALAHFYGN